MTDPAALLLGRQLKELTMSPHEYFSAGLVSDDNIYEWDIMIMPPPETLYDGGFFKLRMSFPKTYPEMPPRLRFLSKMWHPNVYSDGDVCISILHPPGEDRYGYEDPSERWLPVHTVETIILSVISMLSDPNADSPANIDAAKQYREDPEGFKREVTRLIRLSVEEV